MPRFLYPSDLPSRIALLLIVSLLVIRLVLVFASPLELYADEAQYWRWGTALDWGYYSKPPLIAWVIRASTELLGNTEAGVRLFAPILHAVAAMAIYALSRRMLGGRAALIAVTAYVFMPGIVLSSTVISTDGVLFPFWSLALYLLWRLREGADDWGRIVLLGACIGLGFLAKYAMLYFLVGLALACLVDRRTRQAMLTRKGGAVLAIAGLVLAPHLAWNAANSFQTVGHTVDNANLGGELFNLENLPRFLGDQMGVFGPVSFLALLAGLIFLRRRDPDTAEIENWLTCFILPVLIIIALQAVLSRAHANWAATAYPAACIFIASVFTRAKGGPRLWAGVALFVALGIQVIPDFTVAIRLGLGAAIGSLLLLIGVLSRWRAIGLFWAGIGLQATLAIVLAVVTLGPSSWISAAGLDNTFKRTRGWADLSAQLIQEAERLQPTAILLDEREIWHGIDFYTKDTRGVPLILWRPRSDPHNFAELEPLTDEIDDRVLVASYRPEARPRVRGDFGSWEKVGVIEVDLGHRSNGCPLSRTLHLYLASDFDPPVRDATWSETYRGATLDAPPPCPDPAG